MTDLRYVPRPYAGKCRACNRKRPVFSASRKGGGSYKRGNRWYRSAICGECVVNLGPLPERGSGHMSLAQWSLSDLRAILAALALPDDDA